MVKPGSTRLTEAETLAAKSGFRDRLDPTRNFLHASREREDDRIEADRQRHEAELQAARDKQQTAEAHAAALRKRSGILVSVLVATLVIAAVAVILGVQADKDRNEADNIQQEAKQELSRRDSPKADR